jgi:hypothetical protein
LRQFTRILLCLARQALRRSGHQKKIEDHHMPLSPARNNCPRFLRHIFLYLLVVGLALCLAACAGNFERAEEIGREMVRGAAERAESQVMEALAESPVETAPVEPVADPATDAMTLSQAAVALDEPVEPAEVAPRIISLQGDLMNRGAEVSGMAWWGDRLVIMPQYTNFADSTAHVWYTLPKGEILAWVRGEIDQALTPAPLPVVTNNVPEQIPGYEGFESIKFDEAGGVYLTAEATANWVTAAWLVRGLVPDDGGSVALQTDPITWIEPQSLTLNHSDESLVLTPDNGLFTLYEVNGAAVNTSNVPLAHTFGRDLSARGAIPFPTVEYRVTDATALDADNRFWAINYFFPNDDALAVDADPIAEEYGEGATHAASPQVERLLEFQWLGDRIERTATPPIQLQLSLLSRNWEGIVRLDDGGEHLGFLIVTDQFPDTILAFVEMP